MNLYGIFPRTLRERFTVIALLCSGAVFLIGAPLMIWQAHQTMIVREEHELEDRLEAGFTRASVDLYGIEHQMSSMTDVVQLWRPSGSQSWFVVMEELLNRLPEAYGVRLAFEPSSSFNPGAERTFYVRQEGGRGRTVRQHLSYQPDDPGSQGRQWYLPAIQSGVSSMAESSWSQPYASTETGRRAVVSCLFPINRVEAGKPVFDGVAAVDITIDSLLKQMSAIDTGLPFRLYILDSGQNILAGMESGPSEKDAARRLDAFIRSNPAAMHSYQKLRNPTLDVGSFIAADPFDRGKSFFVSRRVPGLPLRFLYVFSFSRFGAGIWLYAGGVMLSGLACIIVIALLFRWSAGLATRNLDLLRDGVREVQAGNFNTIRKLPVTRDETVDVIDAFNGMVEELNRSILKREEMARSQQRLSTELALAHTIQASVLPEPMKLLGGSHFSLSIPAQEVGGDFYDHFVLPGGLTAFAVGDISGKGISAAMFMMRVSLLLRSVATVSEPDEAITRINAILAETNPTMMFVTLFLVVMDPVEQKLRYVNAGHNPPVLVRVDGSVESLAQRSGPAVGVLGGSRFTSWEVPFGHGDLLAIYTDGVSEAMSPSGEQFGMDRLNAFMAENRARPVDTISLELSETAQAWQASDERFDDITLSLLRAGRPSRVLRLPASLDTIDAVVSMIESVACEGGMEVSAARELSLAACEAVTNVISYSLREEESLAYSVFAAWSGDDMVVRIEDPGPPFDPSALPPVDVSVSLEDRQIGGLGWFIIGKSTDQYRMYRVADVNILVMVRSRTRPTMGNHLKTKED
ncbi:MAG: SpoIIE family protein phosphatase [Chlorobiaceae bacterium]|nr:SpoIIE family protein phosphatase [Chlorobiaceae bacterium]